MWAVPDVKAQHLLFIASVQSLLALHKRTTSLPVQLALNVVGQAAEVSQSVLTAPGVQLGMVPPVNVIREQHTGDALEQPIGELQSIAMSVLAPVARSFDVDMVVRSCGIVDERSLTALPPERSLSPLPPTPLDIDRSTSPGEDLDALQAISSQELKTRHVKLGFIALSFLAWFLHAM